MHRRDFERVAKCLKGRKPPRRMNDSYMQGAHAQWVGDVHAMAYILDKNYPHFDIQKFLKACGEEPE